MRKETSSSPSPCSVMENLPNECLTSVTFSQRQYLEREKKGDPDNQLLASIDCCCNTFFTSLNELNKFFVFSRSFIIDGIYLQYGFFFFYLWLLCL